jgi:hypothetical protein
MIIDTTPTALILLIILDSLSPAPEPGGDPSNPLDDHACWGPWTEATINPPTTTAYVALARQNL